MSEFVADASAILAFAQGERGEERVGKVRHECVVASLNLLEAYSKLIRRGMSADFVCQFLRESFPHVVPLDRELAEGSAVLHARLHKLNFSYADCVCLSLGSQRKAIILTGDRKWDEIDIDAEVELIR